MKLWSRMTSTREGCDRDDETKPVHSGNPGTKQKDVKATIWKIQRGKGAELGNLGKTLFLFIAMVDVEDLDSRKYRPEVPELSIRQHFTIHLV